MEESLLSRLRRGCVIPAHPLALSAARSIDVRRQKALTRYYLHAGAGGLAVGVHMTQFAIHDPRVGLYRPVLELAAEAGREQMRAGGREPILIAGIVGSREQAVSEAVMAAELGFHVGLLSLGGLAGQSNSAIADFVREVASIIPVMVFYMPPELSGMTLCKDLWHILLEIQEIVAIKIAPFDRYLSLDVIEAVAESGRAQELALYTGNDDAIVYDLLTPYSFNVGGEQIRLHIVGGLLGQWACWTRAAVRLFEQVRAIRDMNAAVPPELLDVGAQFTLANRAIFDVHHNFKGCIPGVSYVLHRQGLLENMLTLDANERLSEGQSTAIDYVVKHYPHLTDDDFVSRHSEQWLTL